jgi:C-8 sterol isomerase
MPQYVFDPEGVDACARAGLGKPKPQMFESIEEALEERYPGHIDRSQPWIYSIAGGAMIEMKLYHCSLCEYIMIWGTPIGSEGHSGRHLTEFWDTVIDGETWYYSEGQFERTVYKPGDRIFVGRGQAVGMNFVDGVWAVEYARGPLPIIVPFGLADVLLSTDGSAARPGAPQL